MTGTTAASTRVPVSVQLIGGPAVLLEIGGLRLLTDPAFDAPGPVPSGDRTLTKTTGPAVAADFDMVTGVSLRGFFSITRQAIAAVLRSNGTRRGHVVDISTSLVDHASTAVPSALASLTKGGLNAVTRSLAIEYAGCGVRVTTVSPGIIRTPMHAEETHDTLAALHPAGRMGDVGDIVEAIAYLETAEFVTGEILHVDGGQSAGH